MRQRADSRPNAGVFVTRAFALIVALVCVDVTSVCGLQSSVLADLKQAERASASRISNKVKRAQEVVMFGNQQNKLSDHSNYLPTDKRDMTGLPVPDVQNNLDKDDIEEPVAMASIDPLPPYPQLSALRNRYYYDEPDIYDTALYDDRQKRNGFKRLPMKRSDRIFRPFYDNSRAKRESQLSQLDPEELLSLLATWDEEQQQQQQQHTKHQPSWRGAGHNGQSEYEPYSNEYLSDSENDDSQENEEPTPNILTPEWLDGPVPTHNFVKPRLYPPYATSYRSYYDRLRRKNKSVPENEYGHYERGSPQRRYAL